MPSFINNADYSNYVSAAYCFAIAALLAFCAVTLAKYCGAKNKFEKMYDGKKTR